MAHTQGEWKKVHGLVLCGDKVICTPHKMRSIGEPLEYDAGEATKEMHSNGHMLAASEAMYEALKYTYEILRVKGVGTAHLEPAIQAIAKAEGK